MSQAKQFVSAGGGGGWYEPLEEEGASEILGHRIHTSLKLFEERFFHHRTETERKINRGKTGYEVGLEH